MNDGTGTRITEAIRNRQWDEALALLRKNPRMIGEAPAPEQLSPLHHAAAAGAPLPVIQELLLLGASPSAQSATGALPYDLAKAGGHDEVLPLLLPPEQALERIRLSDSLVTDAMNLCALRFDGYAFLESLQNTGTPVEFSDLLEPVVKSLILHPDQNRNFAAFFALQRFLFKWGGEHLTAYSSEHIAYDFLFLHLYRLSPRRPFTIQNL